MLENKKERLKYVDILRVIAMITVLVCHYQRSLEYLGITYYNSILPDNFFNLYLGSFGVAIFFVLSGISLMYTYAGTIDIKKYFVKRFLGIFPMYWTAWIIAFLYYFWKNGGFRTNIPYSKIILTVIGMDGYTNWYGANFYLLGEWFLGCLLLLYLLFPLLKWGVEKHPTISAIVIGLIYIVWPLFYEGTIPVANFFVFRIPEFAFGMYFVHYFKKVKMPIGIISGALLALFWFVDFSNIDVLYKNTFIGIIAVIFIAWVCQFIKWEPIYSACQIIGKYAYAVFLSHHVISMEIAWHFCGKTITRLENYCIFLIYVILVAIASKILVKFNNILINKNK